MDPENRASVWLIEDNEAYRRTIGRVINRLEGFSCPQAFAWCEEAIKLLKCGETPDVILLDVGLPGMNGLEGIRLIKSISPSTHVIMLTVFDDHEKIFRSICAGASGYLLKTSSEENIALAIREVMQGGAAMARDLADGLRIHFSVPQVSLRLWNVAPDHAGEWFTGGVSDDARIFANSLRAPYCGPNNDFEAVRWLEDPAAVRSTVMLPLGQPGQTFGMLVMGSPDPDRFTTVMGTDFLVHIAATASTALAPLRA